MSWKGPAHSGWSHPLGRGLALYKKAGWASHPDGKSVSSVLLWPLLQFIKTKWRAPPVSQERHRVRCLCDIAFDITKDKEAFIEFLD